MTGRERLLSVMAGCGADRLGLMPITMMFAARETGALYRDYATDFRVLAEAQMRTAEAYGFDYVSTISDPAREAADLGAAVEWFADQPPAIIESRGRLADKTALASLRPPDPLGGGRMHDRIKGVGLLRECAGNDLAVEGWVEGPCAMGADLRGINTLMLDFHDDPVFVRDLFEFVIANALAFARPQVEAGADLIGIGDAAASLVGPAIYEEFVWPYEKRLVDGLHALGTRVRLHICGNTKRILAGMGRLGADMVDLDWMAPVDQARRAMGPKQVLAGNLDPVAVLMNGTPERITAATAACHAAAGANYIVTAGCEVVRDTPPGNLRAFCEYAHRHRPEQFG